MEADLAALEQKLASLIAHTRALRAANEDLRAKLVLAAERERALEARMRTAAGRLDAVIARMPAE
jgi:regulator of replication initiation timing